MRLKGIVLSGILLLLLSYNSFSQVQTARNISMTPNSDGYYEYLPAGYNSGTQTYPLIVFIHGLGELGNIPMSNILGGGLPGLINQGRFPASFTINGQTSSFIVISPHFNPAWPVPTDIQEILNYLVQHYRIDQTRIYMTGLSMGGGVTWEYAGDSPVYANRLAAIVPIAGASWPEPIRGRVIANANLAVWATHNSVDPTVPVSYTNDYITNINTAPAPNPLAKKTIFPVTGHDAWSKTYDPNWKEDGVMNIYQWMLQYSRSTAGPNPNQAPAANAGPNQTIALPTSVITLNGSGTDADGTIVSYAWAQINGTAASITSPSSASTTITGLTTTGSRLFALTVRDDKGASGTSYVTVTVNPAPKAIPGRIEAESWDAKSGPQYAVASTDAGGGQHVIGITNGSSMDYNVNVASTGMYTINFRIATSQIHAQFQVKSGNTVLGTINIPGSGDWNNWITVPLTNVPLTAGVQTLRILSTNNESCNFNWTDWALTASGTAPSANAGPPQVITLPVSQVTLTGTGTANNGGTITYAWSQVSGPNAAPVLSIVTPAAASTNVTGLIQGGYVFRLTVTDNNGGATTSDVTVTVNPVSPPTANAGSNQTIILPASQVTLTGTGAANNGGTVTYAWTRLSGPNTAPALSIVTPTAASTNVTGLIQGTYVFRLTVTRNDNQTATSDVTVTVSPVLPPTANAGSNQTITLPTSQVTLTGTGVANNGGTITYAWTRISGPNATPALSIVTPAAASTNVTGLIQGAYVFRLTVTQSDNQTATSDVTVTVNPVNASTPFGGTRRTIPGKLEAEDYDNGGQNTGYYDGTTVNIAGAYRPAESVDTRSCPDIGGGYCVGWTTDGEWLKFSVNVTTTGVYIFTARTGTLNTGKSIQFQVDGVTVGTLTVINSGGYDNWQTATLNNIPLTAGNHVFRFLFNTGDATNPDLGFDINWFNFALAPTQLPSADAGSPQTIILPASQVTLTGSGAANNGGTVTYAWTRVSGPNTAPALSIVTPTAASTNVTGLIQGTYVFRLTVTRNDNQAATSDVTVTVSPVQPPTANAGANQTIILPISQVTLTGTGVANNGGTITYAWTRVSGPNTAPALSIVTPTAASTNVTGLIQGTYVFRLTVTQSDNQTATSDVTITVNPVNASTPYGGTRRSIPGKLEAEDYDNGGQNTGYYDGTTVNIAGAYRPAESVDTRSCPDIGGGYCVGWTTDGEWLKFSVNVTTTGVYIFTARTGTLNTGKSIQFQVDGVTVGTLTVINSGGYDNWQTDTLNNVQLTAGNHVFRFLFNTGDATNPDLGFDINWFNLALAPTQLPSADAGSPQTIILPTSQVTLTGSGAANNGGTITYAWTRVSGPNTAPALSIVTPTAASTNVTGLIQGTYVFRLTVTRNDNQAATSDVTITVNPVPAPTANAGSNQTILLPISQVTLTGSGVANNGGTITYAWTRVSGPNTAPALSIATPAAASTNVTGLIQGTYVFRLTVTQNDNQAATSDVTITVTAVQPPTANAGSAQAITLPISQVTLTGSGTVGNGGTITYGWTQVSGTTATITTPLSASATVTGLTTSGVRVFRLTVTQSDNQTATSDVTITVNPASNGKTIPGKIEAESWDAKSGGMYAIPTTDAGGGMKVVGISNGSSMDYNVTVVSTGTYTVNFRTATTQALTQFQLKLGNTVLGTINIPGSGDWNNWITVSLNNVSLTAGAQTLRILSTNNETCDFNWMDFALSSQAGTNNVTATRAAPVDAQNTLPVLEPALNSSIAIFPNPVQDRFVLRSNNNYEGAMRIQIIDANGKMMKEIQAIKNKGRSEIYLSANGIRAGTYIIRLQMGGWIKSIKMIKL